VTCSKPSVNVTDGRCPQNCQRQFSVGVIAFHEKAGRSQDRRFVGCAIRSVSGFCTATS
jgi:hypothetical protein